MAHERMVKNNRNKVRVKTKLFFFETLYMAKMKTLISIEKTTSKAEFIMGTISVLKGSRFASMFTVTYAIPATIMCFIFVRSRKDNKVIE